MTLAVRELHVHDIPAEPKLWAEDEVECLEAGLDVRTVLVGSIERSDEAWVFEADGVPLVYGGYAILNILAGRVFVWMLGTPEARRFPLAVARMGRRALSGMLAKYNDIRVNTHCAHASGQRWAEWLGFEEHSRFGPWIEYRATKGAE